MSAENFAEIEALGEKYAEAEANRIYLLEYRKSLKAILMSQAEADSPGMALQKQERYAYSHKEYLLLLDGIKAAVYQSAKLRHQIKVMDTRFETWRTKQATLRAEMNIR
jgi:hypothetical protein